MDGFCLLVELQRRRVCICSLRSRLVFQQVAVVFIRHSHCHTQTSMLCTLTITIILTLFGSHILIFLHPENMAFSHPLLYSWLMRIEAPIPTVNQPTLDNGGVSRGRVSGFVTVTETVRNCLAVCSAHLRENITSYFQLLQRVKHFPPQIEILVIFPKIFPHKNLLLEKKYEHTIFIYFLNNSLKMPALWRNTRKNLKIVCST